MGKHWNQKAKMVSGNAEMFFVAKDNKKCGLNRLFVQNYKPVKQFDLLPL